MNLFEKHAQLNQLFQHSPVEAAYLSGSLASRAAFGEMTDVDIAILLAHEIARDHFLDYQLYFLSELTKRLESDALDVVILNQASLLLKLQVIKYGQILYSRDEAKRAAFEAQAVMQYLNFRKMDDLQNSALSRRLRTPQHALDRSGIRAALGRLRAAHTTLAETLPPALDDDAFAQDVRAQAVVERCLLLSIEALAQTATLIYAGMGIPQPETYGEALKLLAARQIVPAEIITALEPLAAQRDTLLRTPEQIDRAALHALARRALPDLLAFARAIEVFLGEDA